MTTTEITASPPESSSQKALKWLALALTPGVGAGRGRKLVELFDGVGQLFNASLTELEGAGLPAAAAQSIALGKSAELAAEAMDRVKAFGGQVISRDDPNYPQRLNEIYDPPLVLVCQRKLGSY